MPEFCLAPVFSRQLCGCQPPCSWWERTREARRVRLMAADVGFLFRGFPAEHWADEDRRARLAYFEHVEGWLKGRQTRTGGLLAA